MPNIRSLLRPLGISASGLSAMRARMEAITENIANAETTRTPEGGPYRRKVVTLEPQRGDRPVEFGTHLENQVLSIADSRHFPNGLPLSDRERNGGVRVAGVEEDQTEGPLVYDPGHPDADVNGYVRMPNVDVTMELADLMITRRVYEANATAFEAGKNILRRSLEL